MAIRTGEGLGKNLVNALEKALDLPAIAHPDAIQ
jgi:hypothetical protein